MLLGRDTTTRSVVVVVAGAVREQNLAASGTMSIWTRRWNPSPRTATETLAVTAACSCSLVVAVLPVVGSVRIDATRESRDFHTDFFQKRGLFY